MGTRPEKALSVRHSPALVVHGGAWSIPPEEQEAHRAGCAAAAARGRDVLLLGGSALDAVEAAILMLEDDPTFDAGTGSVCRIVRLMGLVVLVQADDLPWPSWWLSKSDRDHTP